MRKRWKVAYSILGGALAWSMHLLLTYAIGEFACVRPGSLFYFLGWSAAGWGLAAVSLLCLAAGAGSVWAGRKLLSEGDSFSGLFGIAAGVLFTATILTQTFPLFFLLGGC